MVLSGLNFWWGAEEKAAQSRSYIKATDLSAGLRAGCEIKKFKAKAKWLQSVFVLLGRHLKSG